MNPAGSFAGSVEHSVTGAARLSNMPARPRRPSARVATRTGDGGETSLFGKERVRKTDPRIAALGDLDETQAVIGLARSLASRSSLGRELLELQRGLYLVMAEVATPRDDLGRLKERLDGAAVARLDQLLETLKKKTPIEGRFVVPGENRISASLDHARTVARRAERRVVECVDDGYVSGDHLLPWLNRLSDVLFVLARASERNLRARR
jgi:cob(I)alamin adenosyltransferase